MWHTVNHDAFAMVNARNVASAAENNCCLTSAIVNHEFDGRHTTAWLNAHALDFSGNFCTSRLPKDRIPISL
jgi:hypothetical protein